ncbi:hypothetical protein CsSME_00044326 [Camellia sinensis var. sinensis]
MKEHMRGPVVGLLWWILAIASLDFSFCNGNSTVSCIAKERQALLRFKDDLTDPSSWLSSWSSNDDCCSWNGVVCDNFSGHVRELHLQGSCTDYSDFMCNDYIPKLGGKLNPSLLNLKDLNYLNLSYNDFGGIEIPNFIGSLRSLEYLDLSKAGFSGVIPQTLGNLTSLHYLDLQHCSSSILSLENFQWISGLLLLQHLDLSCVDLSQSSNWLQMTSMLPSLVELHLRYCQLDLSFSLLGLNFTSLAVLDLSGNYFKPLMPNWLFGLTGLDSLVLPECGFSGPIPNGLQNMTSLRDLDLSWNRFNSTIPIWFYNFKGLKSLNLGGNDLQGPITDDIGNMTSIIHIDLSYNEIEGRIPRSMGGLCSTKFIDFSYNKFGDISDVFRSLTGCISDNLETLRLRECQLSGSFSDNLGQFKNLQKLDLSVNSIVGPLPWSIGRLSSLKSLYLNDNRLNGTIPESLGNLTKLEELYISYNFLEGIMSETHFANLKNLKILDASGNLLIFKVSPKWIPPFQLDEIGLRSCHLGPRFPNWLQLQKKLSYLDFSSTGISGNIPTWFWNLSSGIHYLNLSHNQIHGEIPYIPKHDDHSHPVMYLSSNQFGGPLPTISPHLVELDLSNNSFSGDMTHFLCGKSNETIELRILILRENLLSGEIPDCWMNWQSIEVINLRNNNLKGSIPSSISFLSHLISLQVRNNSLSGEFPPSLQNCTQLLTIDLGMNKFVGSIPAWIGKSLLDLKFLILRSNRFIGEISSKLCHLTSLQILDLADNKLIGTIPWCVNKFTAMTTIQNSSDWIDYSYYYGQILENEFVVTKGNEYQYSTILPLLTSLDLSSNNLSGEIPEELTSLLGLRLVNLSRNHLTGMIPKKIGYMKSLDSIDLSRNQLSGKIPSSMSNLNFLGYLDISYNNLSGKIPTSTQLQSFNASSFVGNKLCGPPLTQTCSANGEPVNNGGNKVDKREEPGVDWFYLCMALGFAMGFWGVCVPLLFFKSWRCTYFQFLDIMWDKLCVACGCW